LLPVAGRRLIATPAEVLRALRADAPALAVDLAATAGRAGVGLVLGVGAGIVVGSLAALVVRRAPVVDAMLDFARSVPPVVLLPIWLLALGYNESAKIATVAAGCAFPIALAVTTAAASQRSARREVLDVSGASRRQALAWTEPWESLGVLAVGLRTTASTAVVVAVVTEMVAGAEHGVGSSLISAQIAGDAPRLTLAILAVGALGYLVNLGLRRVEAWARAMGA
jgi:NitT/TauT family transport system permease protein